MGLFGTGLRRIWAVGAASPARAMSKMVRSALKQTTTGELRRDSAKRPDQGRFLAVGTKPKYFVRRPDGKTRLARAIPRPAPGKCAGLCARRRGDRPWPSVTGRHDSSLPRARAHPPHARLRG